jgi:hypothetical protein
MMTRRHFALTLPTVLAAPAITGRLRAESPEDKGRKLKDQLVDALGGERFLNMHDRTEQGRAYSFFREQLSGLSVVHIYTQYQAKAGPGDFPAVRERQAFGVKQDDAIIFADGSVYEITYRGARPLADERLNRYIETTNRNIFYILRQRSREEGMIFESTGGDVVENQPVLVLKVTDPQNRTVTVYLHHTTFLPVMQRFSLMDPILKERREEVTRFNKYRSVGGVMWPYDIQRERDGEKIFQMFAENVTINNNLADKLFVLPSGMKLLKKDV